MEPNEIVTKLSEKSYDVRFDYKATLLDQFVKAFATKTMFRILGIIPKRSPVLTHSEDYAEFSKLVSEIPSNLIELAQHPTKPTYEFPASDKWMHWIRSNAPENMPLEQFEKFIFDSDLFGYKWMARYIRELKMFTGIRIVTNFLAFFLHGLLAFSIGYFFYNGRFVMGFFTCFVVIVALILSACASKEKLNEKS